MACRFLSSRWLLAGAVSLLFAGGLLAATPDWVAKSDRNTQLLLDTMARSSPEGAVGPGWLRSACVILGTGKRYARSSPVFASRSMIGPPG